MNKSETIQNLTKALVAVQSELANVAKNANNTHFKNDYADLSAITSAVRPVLSKHGLVVAQFPATSVDTEGDLWLSVETVLFHGETAEFISSDIESPVNKPDAQGIGSATTYLRRYSLPALLGIAAESDDDDGNAASGHKNPNSKQAETSGSGAEKKGFKRRD